VSEVLSHLDAGWDLALEASFLVFGVVSEEPSIWMKGWVFDRILFSWGCRKEFVGQYEGMEQREAALRLPLKEDVGALVGWRGKG